MGGYWRGDKWIEITWGHKISERIKSGNTKHRATVKCKHCGKESSGYKTTKFCSRKCSYLHRKNNPDPFLAKVVTCSSGLRLGPGKKDIVADLLRRSIGQPCTYCGKILTMKNFQIDHKTPIERTNHAPIKGHLDKIENLQVVCRRCNCAKGEMDDAQFRKLLAFLETDEAIGRAVWRKLGMSGHGWRAVRSRS